MTAACVSEDDLPLLRQPVNPVPRALRAGDAPAARALFLHLGLQNGVLIRTEVDPLSGRLSDQRTRFLGTRAPTLLPLVIDGAAAIAALSSRPWLGHLRHGHFALEPLAYDALDYVAPFASEKVPEGIVAIARAAAAPTGTLRVLTAERVGEPFTARTLRLAFTPRRVLADEATGTLLVAEADAGVLPYAEREAELQARSRRRPYQFSPRRPELSASTILAGCR